jgi:hypothetical protein
MRIGTIGAGFVARAVATVAIRRGYEVMVFGSIVERNGFAVGGGGIA